MQWGLWATKRASGTAGTDGWIGLPFAARAEAEKAAEKYRRNPFWSVAVRPYALEPEARAT